MSQRLSEHASVSMASPSAVDIGGTNNPTAYVSMKAYARVNLYNELGTWDSSDDLDECRLQQATDTSGSSVKDLTSDASGGNYDTDNPVDADGDFVIIEARGEDLDLDASRLFDVVRGYVAEGGNTGQDDCACNLTRYGYGYPQKELQGAAVTGSKVYVDTGT